MTDALWQATRSRMEGLRTWLRLRIKESSSCRECQGRVSPMADYCPHCGAFGPAQVQISPAMMVIVGLGVGFILLTLLA